MAMADPARGAPRDPPCASGLSSALPVAAGLSAATGLLARPACELPTTVGELDGVTCAGVVPDDEGDVGVTDEVLGDGLPDDEYVLLDDGLPDDGGLAVPDAVGWQLGVGDPIGPPPCWPDCVVTPPLEFE